MRIRVKGDLDFQKNGLKFNITFYSGGKKSPPKAGPAADLLVPDINDEFMS